jgi:hypothetical protein
VSRQTRRTFKGKKRLVLRDSTHGDFDTPSSSGTDRSPAMVDSRHHRHTLPTPNNRPVDKDSMYHRQPQQQHVGYNGLFDTSAGGALLPPPPPPPISAQWMQPPMQPMMPAQLITGRPACARRVHARQCIPRSTAANDATTIATVHHCYRLHATSA